MSNREEAYPFKDTMTVIRPLDNGTELEEVWVIDSWSAESDVPTLVKCYVSHSDKKTRSGVPADKDCVKDVCEFGEAPGTVQEAFLKKLNNLGKLGEGLK